MRVNGPYIHTTRTTPYIYIVMLVSLIPCSLSGVINYGLNVLINMVVAILVSTFMDLFLDKIIKKKNDYFDLSSPVSGLLLVLILPPKVPVFFVIGAIIFANLIKQIFGGLGGSTINTTCLGALTLYLLLGNYMGYSSNGEDLFDFESLVILRNYEPLNVMENAKNHHLIEIISGSYPSLVGVGGIVFILVGFIYLAIKRCHRFYASLGYLLVIMISLLIMDWGLGIKIYLVHLLSSGAFFVASFLLSDLTTIPSNSRGGIISGIVAGIIAISLIGTNNPILFITVPLLVANLCTSTLEHITLIDLGAGVAIGENIISSDNTNDSKE